MPRTVACKKMQQVTRDVIKLNMLMNVEGSGKAEEEISEKKKSREKGRRLGQKP